MEYANLKELNSMKIGHYPALSLVYSWNCLYLSQPQIIRYHEEPTLKCCTLARQAVLHLFSLLVNPAESH